MKGGRGRGLFLLPFLVVLGCAGGNPSSSRPTPGWFGSDPTVPKATITYSVIADSITDDPAIEALVAPFRERMGEEIRQVIGETEGPLAKAVPEGTLGNFAADAMLWAARRASGDPVHMAMTNNGGLRVPIAPGPVTVGQMYELMPFENMLSVLTLSGSQVQELADDLAAMRGEPIAGFTFRIESQGGQRVARDILVDGEELKPTTQYRIVTNDYLANGGGNLTAIHHPLAREDLPVLLRDAFIEYVEERGTIRVELEGRITGAIGR
jgi:2',3'-cyclic-nucleotide 2'-phosphodiesterase (5'-nucleotidase family)